MLNLDEIVGNKQKQDNWQNKFALKHNTKTKRH